MLSDLEITQIPNLITPFVPQSMKTTPEGTKCISYGLSSYGYDIRLSNDFRVFTGHSAAPIDPKEFDDGDLVQKSVPDHQPLLIPGNSFVLATSLEYFRMPEDVLAICLGKSTYARCGLLVNLTPLEPGWEGNLTIELSNTSPSPMRVYAGEGIAQLLFFRNNPCSTSYSKRGGKYQGQQGLTYAR